MEDEEMGEDVTPPPSDYFLGFKSPGTQIWSRLRQAGLETQRIYSLDTSSILLLLRCPRHRLHDVAEYLRLQLYCRRDGSYKPFSTQETNELPQNFVFSKSERQSIIDFIIQSRIRDSGAELGEGTALGRQIKTRVPLHDKTELEKLYDVWVCFWKKENWMGRRGWSLSVEDDEDVRRNGSYAPGIVKRMVVGSFYQPLDSIKDYYGEGVAFYFTWIQHCSHHLIFLSIVGAIVFLIQIVSGNMDHPIRPYFSCVVMLWSFIVMVSWRRRANELAYRWGLRLGGYYYSQETQMYDTDAVSGEMAPARPLFRGDYRRDPITQEWVLHYPPHRRYLKYLLSMPITIGFTVGSLLGILTVYANRDRLLSRYFFDGGGGSAKEGFRFRFDIDAVLQPSPSLSSIHIHPNDLKNPTFWMLVGGFPLLLGICLPLLNLLFMRLSVLLNDFENYRTESDYRNHLIVKVFSFRFVCYFAALYYYSFLTNNGSDDGTTNGIVRVAASLFVYITVAHWWNILITIFLPYGIYKGRCWWDRVQLKRRVRELQELEEDLQNDEDGDDEEIQRLLLNKKFLLWQASSPLWEETKLPTYNSFQDYVLLVIQFGYITCFSVVLPITPLIVLLNNLLSMRLDAFKLCRGRRRPLAPPKTGDGIGVWEHVLHIVTVIGVLTNCSLMAVSACQFRALGGRIGGVNLLLVVVVWEHAMLFIKYVMQASVNPMPQSVIDDIKRNRYEKGLKEKSIMRAKNNDRRSSKLFTNLERQKSSKSCFSINSDIHNLGMSSKHRDRRERDNFGNLKIKTTDLQEEGRLSTIASLDSGKENNDNDHFTTQQQRNTIETKDTPANSPNDDDTFSKQQKRQNHHHHPSSSTLRKRRPPNKRTRKSSFSSPLPPHNILQQQQQHYNNSPTTTTTPSSSAARQCTTRYDKYTPPVSLFESFHSVADASETTPPLPTSPHMVPNEEGTIVAKSLMSSSSLPPSANDAMTTRDRYDGGGGGDRYDVVHGNSPFSGDNRVVINDCPFEDGGASTKESMRRRGRNSRRGGVSDSRDVLAPCDDYNNGDRNGSESGGIVAADDDNVVVDSWEENGISWVSDRRRRRRKTTKGGGIRRII